MTRDQATIGAAFFSRVVDTYVTPEMRTAGYVRIGRGAASAARELTIGFEAVSLEAMSRFSLDDPLTAEEVWLTFDPNTGQLHFEPTPDGILLPVDWLDTDASLQSPTLETERRLVGLGKALRQLNSGDAGST